MMALQGKKIRLRALEPKDLEFLLEVENNKDYWILSNTQFPFSRHILQKYIENAKQDIYEAKQFRFVITNLLDTPMGFIDLFDFNPQHKRVGVGLLLTSENQSKGYGSEALQIIIEHCFMVLQVHSIYANIMEGNKPSKALFTKFNFKKIGTKKDWLLTDNGFVGETLYQRIKN